MIHCCDRGYYLHRTNNLATPHDSTRQTVLKRQCASLCHIIVLEYALRAAAGAVQQAISDSVGPRWAAYTAATRGPGLTQSTLCQPTLQHFQVVRTRSCLLLGFHAARCAGHVVHHQQNESSFTPCCCSAPQSKVFACRNLLSIAWKAGHESTQSMGTGAHGCAWGGCSRFRVPVSTAAVWIARTGGQQEIQTFKLCCWWFSE